MTKRILRTIAVIMLVIAAVFVVFALNNPQAGFPWSNAVTYTIYAVYLILTAVLFIASFKRK